jgi:hypothetical protein
MASLGSGFLKFLELVVKCFSQLVGNRKWVGGGSGILLILSKISGS